MTFKMALPYGDPFHHVSLISTTGTDLMLSNPQGYPNDLQNVFPPPMILSSPKIYGNITICTNLTLEGPRNDHYNIYTCCDHFHQVSWIQQLVPNMTQTWHWTWLSPPFPQVSGSIHVSLKRFPSKLATNVFCTLYFLFVWQWLKVNFYMINMIKACQIKWAQFPRFYGKGKIDPIELKCI
jgi:hypothetical protein